jgi:histidinol-phosphate aminotransferase
MRAAQFHRSDLDSLPEYVPSPMDGLEGIIKLDSNENPYGPSPRALAALANMQLWQFYPRQEELREAVAAYVGTNPDNVVLSNGADESIDLLMRATLEPNEVVIDCPPSFEMYRVYTQAHRGRLVEVPRGDDFSLDADAVRLACADTHAKTIIIGSPNNPDGGTLPRAELLRFLELPALVVLDEAYAEFAGESAIGLVPHHGNLVVLRTFSKWAGLAGLRVGYAIMPTLLAAAVNKLRSPYNVNAAGLVAARASLDDLEYLMSNVRAIVAERERMLSALTQIEFLQPLPSRGNFVLCRVVGHPAHEVKNHLKRRGILVRAYTGPRLSEYLRFTIGTRAQNDQVLKTLEGLVELRS